ncbi:MAG: FAD-dependent oxidoreductase [Deinococcota bacterium]|nr:FAD-dependent oxidoreductase [Deinococcota bacterium]
MVILGGGHAGVRAARRLLKASRPEDDLDIAMVNHDNVEVWHGLMPQIVGGRIEPSHILVALRTILPGVTLYSHEVKAVDLAERSVTLDRGDEGGEVVITFDHLVLALGSVTDLSRFPGLLEHGLQTKTIGDVFHIHNHLLDMLERASVEQDPEERRRTLTFVVAGAGFAGVEIASQANNLIRSALRFYPTIEEAEVRLVVVSHSARILPAISETLASRAARFMERNKIEFKLKTELASATTNAAILSSGEVIATRTLIVTVGVGPNPVITGLPLALQHDRVVCDECCRVLGQPGVYAVGDNAAIPNEQTGRPFPPTAIYAFSQGECAAENILRERRGQPLKRYRPVNLGDAALLTTNYGVAQLWGVPLEGVLAAAVWRLTIMTFLHSWKRRFAFLMDWLSATLFPPDMTQLRIARSDSIIPLRFAAGDTIIREGEPGSRFYIVNEGEVEVLRRAADGGEEQVARLGPGRYFGEVALLYEVKRTGTVRATVDTTVLSMARQDFTTLVEHIPVLREAFDHSSQNAIKTAADEA